MNLLHKILEKAVLATFALCFTFVSLYVPHNYNQVEVVEAGSLSGVASEFTQLLNNAQLLAVNGFTSISAAVNPITSAMTSNSWLKDSSLDAIAWALAKSILSTMTSSIVNWINRGFDGSPRFVQDINKHLTDTADKAFGEYLEDLGGPFSFVCAPFKLDVKLALEIEYDMIRGKQGQTTSSCTLTGALKNIEGFIDNTQNFTEAGGWDAWFDIASNPTTYTSYGNILTAKSGASVRILNAKNETMAELSFGDGFLSSKICEMVEGSGTSREDCFISTPGKVINEALTFQLSTGPRSLIAADEINEIVSALFAQLAKQAVTGVTGLLGLSASASGGGSIADQLGNSDYTSDPNRIIQLLNDSRNVELNFQVLASFYEDRLRAYAADTTKQTERRTPALYAANAIPTLVQKSQNNVQKLDDLISRYNAIRGVDPVAIQTITQEYLALSDLNTKISVDTQELTWNNLLKN